MINQSPGHSAAAKETATTKAAPLKADKTSMKSGSNRAKNASKGAAAEKKAWKPGGTLRFLMTSQR